MRTCYDSTRASDIPLTAVMVAGYVDGIWRWSDADWQRFSNAVKVPIACFPTTNDGVVGDVETGDMLPWELPDWVRLRRAAGVDPTGYVNLSNWNPTRTEFHLRGIPEPHWWLADYDNNPSLPTGTVAKQYANSVLAGGHYDLSVVADNWPGVDMTQAEFNALVAGNEPLQRLFWRVDALLGDTPTTLEPGQPPETNQVHAQLEAIKTAQHAAAPARFSGTLEGTLT